MNLDIVSSVLRFCGGSFLYKATVSRTWRDAYHLIYACQKTSVRQAVSSPSTLEPVLPTLRLNDALNDAAFFHASRLGDTSVLDTLLSNNRTKGMYTCAFGAADSQNLGSLSWAVSKGFSMDRFVCHKASSTGNLDMLRWAVDHGCPWDPEVCLRVSTENGFDKIKNWISNR